MCVVTSLVLQMKRTEAQGLTACSKVIYLESTEKRKITNMLVLIYIENQDVPITKLLKPMDID